MRLASGMAGSDYDQAAARRRLLKSKALRYRQASNNDFSRAAPRGADLSDAETNDERVLVRGPFVKSQVGVSVALDCLVRCPRCTGINLGETSLVVDALRRFAAEPGTLPGPKARARKILGNAFPS